jgi:hypothetical protein
MDLVRLAAGIVSFSRSVTLAGWLVIAAAIAAAWIGSVVSEGRFPSGLALLRMANRRVVVRIFVLLVWLWVGWHFFVRTSR